MTKTLNYTAEQINNRLTHTQYVNLQATTSGIIARTAFPIQDGETLALFRRTRSYRHHNNGSTAITNKRVYKYTMIQRGKTFNYNNDDDKNNAQKQALVTSMRWNTNGDYYILCDSDSIEDNLLPSDIGSVFIVDDPVIRGYVLQDGRNCKIIPGRSTNRQATLHLGVAVVRQTQKGYDILSNIAKIKINISADKPTYPSTLKYTMQCDQATRKHAGISQRPEGMQEYQATRRHAGIFKYTNIFINYHYLYIK